MSRTLVFQAMRLPLPSAPPGRAWARRRRTLQFVLWILLVLAAGTAVALSTVTLPGHKYGLFSTTVEGTSFAIDNQDVKIKGKNTVEVSLTLRNAGTATHTADVTVQLYKADGTMLLEQTQNAGSVASAATIDLTYSFTQAGLTTEYSETFVIVRETA